MAQAALELAPHLAELDLAGWQSPLDRHPAIFHGLLVLLSQKAAADA